MGYHHVLKSGVVIASTRPEHAGPLAALQELCFPTLAPEQRFVAAHYRKHLELFPEGQFVALDGDRVVGGTSTCRLHFDFNHVGHTFDDVIQGGWLTSHERDGDWLYGADISVHPDHRGRGLARGLYAARQDTVRRLGLEGQVTAGMMRGYGAVKDRMSAEEYYRRLANGSINDPTLSAQMKIGFELRGLLPHYVHDPVCDDYAVLIVLDASRDVPSE
jgi:GNAT superfamily N-acetyltransferase